MDQAIRDLVRRTFPELTAGYHLPRFGRVIGLTESQKEGDIADDFRPHYAVDVEILTEQGEPDPAFPPFHDVPLPVPMAGNEQGMYGKPEIGTWVEIAFAYGSPNRPFIRCVLPHSLSLPALDQYAQRWQHSTGIYQLATTKGNWQRVTHQDIVDLAARIERIADISEETFGESKRSVERNDTEEVKGTKHIEAMGALLLLSGGKLGMTAIDGIDLATSADLTESIGRIRDSIATERQRIKVKDGGKLWVGSQSENALRILSELLQLVIDITNVIATHTHPNVGVTNQSGTFSSQAGAVGGVRERLDRIIE
uniref:Gp5/Type VI secretion system Vgr protein OB-fold domain-containing protein n=1 Tax=Candidatus Kentrum sp. LFY TaxID=2126342 RepID=A0A450WI10_9GAMM|nr:MAG: hypothetical protein BECKLFY1418C_GA0070996_102513 [Candidatus Kentron sp. LFY]